MPDLERICFILWQVRYFCFVKCLAAGIKAAELFHTILKCTWKKVTGSKGIRKAECMEQNELDKKDQELEEFGQTVLEEGSRQRKIHLLTIIGEVEGHENASGSCKTTKYDQCCRNLLRLRMMLRGRASGSV